ncbi:MAG TPA: DUF420 domain-containing protein [Thermodesulfobacteriota bacterium]|nr:DUF420 domain-containing protein [Thermodesulfobacteriota bacterium]
MYTYENIFFLVGNFWGVASCLLLIAAWLAIYLDKERYERLHRKVMIVMVAGGWAFVVFYLSGIFLRTAPMTVAAGIVPWIAAHGTIALLTLTGATLLLWARLTDRGAGDTVSIRAHLNRRHTLYGRVITPLWFFSHVGGVVNLYLVG